jgi:hypothetical protein
MGGKYNLRILKILQNIYPPLEKNRAHAKNIQRALGVSLGIAQIIVAHMYGCRDWSQLKQKSGQMFDSSVISLPMCYLTPHELVPFELLVTKYRPNLIAAHSNGTYLQEDLLSRIVYKQFGAIEHYQIEQILSYYADCEQTFDRFLEALSWANNTASFVTKTARFGENSNCTINLWLNSCTYQQDFYAYYEFQDEHLRIRVREWDTGVRMPNPELHVCNSSWYVDFMYGYLEMLARQFVMLGYQPFFEIMRIQGVYLPHMGLEYEDNNHRKHGVLKLVRRLLERGGIQSGDKRYNPVEDNRGLKIAFSEKSFSTI